MELSIIVPPGVDRNKSPEKPEIDRILDSSYTEYVAGNGLVPLDTLSK